MKLRLSRLAWAALVVLVLSLAHELDHLLNQPDREFSYAVILTGVASGGTLWLALRHDPLAPLAGLSTGLAVALGFAAIHLAPHWSALSSPYSTSGVNWLSWLIVFGNIAAGLGLAFLGARQLFRQGGFSASIARTKAPA